MPKRIVIAFSDTGGGHRSAAEAIRESLVDEHSADAHVTLVDVFKHYTPYPFNRLPAWYPSMLANDALAWKLGYRLIDGQRRAVALNTLTWPYLRTGFRRFVREHACDVMVSVHPLMVSPLLKALGRRRPPFITVVTDLVTTPNFWYHRRTDLCIVPTEPALRHALRCGLHPDRVRVIGLPVAARFTAPAGDKPALKQALGWSADRPTILMVGGGEGMGPLYDIARAVADARLPCELAVVAGRNQALRERLEATDWATPAHVYGFVTDMPDFMAAADVIVTKAGPGTISEALIAGLPILLFSYIPGQEAGNVAYVVEQGAGVYTPRPERMVELLRRWIGPGADPADLRLVAANARRLGRPQASKQIAAAIWRAAA